MEKISKHSFKKIIKTKANKLAIEYLKTLKAKHSKMKNIEINEKVLKPTEYLTDTRIYPEQAKFIFKMRTRMYSVKCNFKNNFNENYICDLCKVEEDSQEHLLQCKVLQHFVPEILKSKVRYEDIFGSIDQIIEASKLLKKICKEREELLKVNEPLQII